MRKTIFDSLAAGVMIAIGGAVFVACVGERESIICIISFLYYYICYIIL